MEALTSEKTNAAVAQAYDVYHDQDTVYTSYKWLDRLLLEDRANVSYSTRGAKDNPRNESH